MESALGCSCNNKALHLGAQFDQDVFAFAGYSLNTRI